MPRYTPAVARLKAEKLIKPYIESGFNQTEVALREGVSQSAISQRLQKKPVQDYLQKYINSPKLKKTLVEVANEALSATLKIKIPFTNKEGRKEFKLKVFPDYDARHKYWHDLLTAVGVLKINGNGNGVKIINIINGSPRCLNRALREE